MSVDYLSADGDDSYIDYNKNNAYLTDQDIEKTLIFRITVGIYLFILILVGFFGNILVLQIIIFKLKIQNSFNLFLANIAIADIFFIIYTIIIITSHMLIGEFIFGDIVCKVTVLFGYFGPILSILTLMTALITLQFNIGIMLSALIIGFLYLITSLPTILQTFSFGTFNLFSTNGKLTMCGMQYVNYEAKQEILELERIFEVKIPVAILSIYMILWIIHRSINCTRLMSGFMYEKLMIIMAFVYVIFWIPALYCTQNVEDIHDKFKIPMFCILLLCNLVSGATIIYKPFLYISMHEGINKEFQEFFHIRPQNPERSQILQTY